MCLFPYNILTVLVHQSNYHKSFVSNNVIIDSNLANHTTGFSAWIYDSELFVSSSTRECGGEVTDLCEGDRQ